MSPAGCAQAVASLATSFVVIGSHVVAQVSFSRSIQFSPAGAANYNFGRVLHVADFNQDGFEDLLAAEPRAEQQGQVSSGRAWILFGPVFAQYVELAPAAGNFDQEFGGMPGSLGDVNGDGWIDILLPAVDYAAGPGLQRAGRAYLFLGPDFKNEVIFDDPTPEKDGQFGSGNELVDVTGDGLMDVVISAYWAMGQVGVTTGTLTGVGAPTDGIGFVGEMWWWDARELDQAHLVPALAFEFSGEFGRGLASANLDGQGLDEVLVGATGINATCCPQTGIGQLLALDVASWGVSQVVASPAGTIGFGFTQHHGDLDGDGAADLLVGAPFSLYLGGPIQPNSGKLVVMKGPSFDALFTTLASPTPGKSVLFGAHAAVADVDRDGFDDIVVGDAGETWGQSLERTHIFYGPSFTAIQSLGDDFQLLMDGFGESVAAGDFDGDGFREIAVYAPLTFGTGAVVVYDRQSLMADAAEVSVTAGGQVGFALDLGADVSGGLYLAALTLSGAEPGIVVGPGAFLPLNPDALTSLGLSLVNTSTLQGFLGVLDSNGDASFTLDWPAGFGTVLVGEELTVAAVAATSRGVPTAGTSPVIISLGP